MKYITPLLLVALFIVPVLAHADYRFAPFPYWPDDRTPLLPCTGLSCNDICLFMVLLQRVFYFILTLGVFGFAPLMIAIGGIMVLAGGTSPSTIQTGKSILTTAVIGVAIALLAWVIVATLIAVLGVGNTVRGFGGSASICPDLPTLQINTGP